MLRTIRSLRFVILVIIASFVALTAVLVQVNSSAIDTLVQDQLALDVAASQSTHLYEITTSIYRLANAKTDNDRAPLKSSLQTTMDLFQSSQTALRAGDLTLNLLPLQHPEILAVLGTADTEWNTYRTLITQYLNTNAGEDEADQEKIADQIASQAGIVSAYADRVVKAFQVVAEQNRQTSHQAAAVLFAGLFLAVIASAVALFGVTRSLQSLVLATRQFTTGNYTARARTNTLTEIADMAHVFNDMAGTVQQRDADLTELNKSLEGRVRERTVELATTNESLLGEIAERKRVEAERETLLASESAAKREAEEAVRLKDLFLATMSHELRTPLNAMIGFQNLMLFSGQLDGDNQHMAERSLSNSQRLLSLINNILDVSRIASGRLQLAP